MRKRQKPGIKNKWVWTPYDSTDWASKQSFWVRQEYWSGLSIFLLHIFPAEETWTASRSLCLVYWLLYNCAGLGIYPFVISISFPWKGWLCSFFLLFQLVPELQWAPSVPYGQPAWRQRVVLGPSGRCSSCQASGLEAAHQWVAEPGQLPSLGEMLQQ